MCESNNRQDVLIIDTEEFLECERDQSIRD
jgi:hypothetical protein